MKIIQFLAILIFPFLSVAQPTGKARNIFIITTDGFRWQEVFTGADSLIISNEKYTADTSLAKEMYWDATAGLRRKKLMPFFWNVIAKKGQLYGNRLLDNKFNMKNVFKISYPGYNEILTGYADPHLIPNKPVNNPNVNLLEYLNQRSAYSGRVVAFSSWDIFPHILNEERSNFPVNSGYEMVGDDSAGTNNLINRVQENVSEKGHTRYDMLTYLSAREYIRSHHPKVLFLGFGETDESAHNRQYDTYLQHASMVDKMISDLWYYVQTDPFYKDNTTFIITTDHGRGSKLHSWHRHNLFTKGSGESWLAMIGPGIFPSGEMKGNQQSYGNQLVSTIAFLLGEKFETTQPVGKSISFPNSAMDRVEVVTVR